MGHDTHFLDRLKRLEAGQVEFAFSLYRNARLVRALLAAEAPPGVDRVAIALADDGDTAHVLVSRDGHFVTCLAPGMRHDLPVIARRAVDRAVRKHEDIRDALQKSREIYRDESKRLTALRVNDGPRVSREEIGELMSWGALLGQTFFKTQPPTFTRHAASWAALNRAEELKVRHEDTILTAWRTGWALGHLTGPAAATSQSIARDKPDEPNTPPWMIFSASGTMNTQLVPSALRGAWAVASYADISLDCVTRSWLKVDEYETCWGAGGVLAVVALRWPTLREQAEATLALAPARTLERADELFIAAIRNTVADPKAALLRHVERGSAWLSERLGTIDDLDATILGAAPFYEERAMIAPEDYARFADGLAYVAVSAFEDLYLPQAVLDRLPREQPLDAARQYVGSIHAALDRTDWNPQAVAEPKPGRNDPCHCGSGKKFKKCHGS